MTTSTSTGTDSDPRPVVSTAVTYASFALPAAMLGVMWPDVRAEFGQSLGALGVVSLTYGLARMSTATTGRPLARRLGLAGGFPLLLALLAGSCVLLSAAPTWPVFLVGVAGIGITSGALDSLGAIFITAREQVGSAGLVHGAYGVGATLGPLAVAALPGWRAPVVTCAVVAVVAIAGAWWVRDRWPEVAPARQHAAPPQMPWRVVGISLVAFAAFVAIEVTTGQWAFTWLTDQRSLSQGAAAWAVSAFWGGTTVGRLALSRAGLSDVVVRRGLAPFALGATASMAALVVLPSAVAALPLGLLGLSLGPIMPSLFATTTRRVGRVHGARMAGWQLLATNVGAIGLPALTGLLVDRAGPGVIVTVVLVALVGLGLPALAVLQTAPDVATTG